MPAEIASVNAYSVPARPERLGLAGKARALETHLGDTHLNRWLHVLDAVLSPGTGGAG